MLAHLPRETQRQLVFLDPRHVTRAKRTRPIPVADLPVDAAREAAGPMHFIFHTAFCCSTLMTRALDIPGVSMGIKEPSVLVAFAHLRSSGRGTPGALAALEMTLDLLSRPHTPGETQIVKPSNVTTHIIPQMMHVRPNAKALVMYSPLDAFLRAVARRGMEGRAFARSTYQYYASVIPLDAGFTDEDVVLQTDLQIAAQAWLIQIAFLDSIAKRFGPGRLRTLNSETFLADPAATLAQLASFFDLAIDAPACAAIAAGPVFGEHAKEYGRTFDAHAYRAQLAEAGAAHKAELALAKTWGADLAERCGVPLGLGDTLFH